MDEDRKYRQRGYQDSDRDRKPSGGRNGDSRPKAGGPRPLQDASGPKLPRLVQTVVASRCYSCSTTLPANTDFKGNCPKCGVALHCCKQCSHFESSTRFQCLKPIPVRIAYKDQTNECSLFSPRVTVARDVTRVSNGQGIGAPPPTAAPVVPRTPTDARAAFDSLFKK